MTGNADADRLVDPTWQETEINEHPATGAIIRRWADDANVFKHGGIIIRFDIKTASGLRSSDIFPKRSIERNPATTNNRYTLATASGRMN